MKNAMTRFYRGNRIASFLLVLAGSVHSAAAQELPILATLSTPSLAENNPPAVLPGVDESENDRGALLLCGGGPLPTSVLELFFKYGKGENGKLVIIPTASSLADSGDYARVMGSWSDFNWGKVDVLHALDRAQAEVDEFADTLKDATAVWMTGGDQRRLAERYKGTVVEREIRNVMYRGGVVGGTSAGSAIASRVMISGGRKTPQISDGLDLLPNSIIDQHFSQRLRFERLASAVAAHPDRVGIGIDESTGLLVGKKRAQVVGDGAVYVYSNPQRPIKVVRTQSQVEQASADSSDASMVVTADASAEFRALRVAPGEILESHGFPLLAAPGP